jgi:predicted acylesterase/phospholipase RssA
MKIDTLICSGGGPSGIAYNGIFRALVEKKIINQELEGIKEIITASIGILFSFCVMLKLNYRIAHDICMKFDIGSMLNFDEIAIDDFLVDHGFFKTDGIKNIFQSLVKNILKKEDINLQELYEFTKIKLTVKVFNVTRKQVEYISYQNYPDLSIITLAQMTTAIPLFFKPVKYNDNLYVDGGMRGHFPIEECKSKNYLGIFISGGSFPKNSEILKLFPILEFMYSLMINQDETVYQIKNKKHNPRIIFNEVNLGLDFHVKNETQERVIQEAYKITMKHIQDHQLNQP